MSVGGVDRDEGAGALFGSAGPSVGVDALLLAAGNQHGDKFLQNFRSHLTDLKNLVVVHLLLPTVVQRHLQHDKGMSTSSQCQRTAATHAIILITDHVGDEGQTKNSESTVLRHRHFRNCTHT